MKNTLLIYLMLIVVKVFAQEAVVSTQYQDLKINTPNYVEIFIEGVQCDSIFIKTEAEYHKYNTNDCYWVIKPLKYEHHPGLLIKVFQLKGKDTIFISNEYLNVRKIDVMMPSIRKEITKENLIRWNSIPTQAYQGQYGCLSMPAKNFKVFAVRGDKFLFYYNNINSEFSQELIDSFKTLKTNDILYFCDFESKLKEYLPIKGFKIKIIESK